MGGGSATGLAKAVALEHGTPIVAVPTTYAGSEVTPIYGLTGPEGKRTGRDPRALPRTVVYDPALTVGLPAGVTGPSGMNALAHCAEALYAPGANPVTSLLAAEGARRLAGGLPGAVADPGDLAARSDALLGAWLAGSALAAAGVGVHHQLCHLLGGAYRLPHAELHAVMLPHSVRFVAPAARPQVARLAGALGVEDAAGGLWDLARRLGTPASLAELGLAEAELDAAAAQAVARVVQAPRRAGVSDLRALLGDAWHGHRPPPP
jgi:maleylacetate reductase